MYNYNEIVSTTSINNDILAWKLEIAQMIQKFFTGYCLILKLSEGRHAFYTYQTNADLMLGRCLRRRPNSKLTWA